MEGIELFEIQTGAHTSMLTESYSGGADGLEESLSALLPSITGMSLKEIRSEWDLWNPLDDGSGKALPYSDEASLDNMHKVGFRLYRDPNVQTAIECLITFVVFKGWSYAVSKAPGQDYPDSRLTVLKDAHRDLISSVSLGMQRGWYFLQKESYKRFLRDGEYFRRWWIVDGELHVRFVEVFDIRQPKARENIVNFDRLPPDVKVQFNQDDQEIPGELGIVTKPGDAATEIGYWHRIRGSRLGHEQLFEFLPSSRIQHAKCNVDANDPRGVPAFYDAVCPAIRAGEVDEAMNELAVKQSKYAVVHKHRATNRREAIRGLADARTREMNDQMSTQGRSQAEMHVKNVDIEMHGMKTQARNYIEVIQQDQRLIGGIRQIPEYMITNDANTGNRSSLQAATSPFGRRVAQDQKDMWFYDLNLQWNSLVEILNWTVATSKSTQRRTQINVTFPLSETKDPSKDAQKLVNLREDGAISREEQRRQLDVNHEQMQQEIDNEGGVYVSPTKRARQQNSSGGSQSKSVGSSA